MIKRSDLKSGMLIEAFGGKIYMVVLNSYMGEDTIFSQTNDCNDEGWNPIYYFTKNDIEFVDVERMNITKIYAPTRTTGFTWNPLSDLWKNILDKDHQIIKMTQQEIEDQLGYKIGIVTK